MDKDKELPGQQRFDLEKPHPAEPKTEAELVGWAQEQQILKPTEEIDFSKEHGGGWLSKGEFSFKVDLADKQGRDSLRLEVRSSLGSAPVNLIPFAIQTVGSSPQEADREWNLFFTPVFGLRNKTVIRIQNLGINEPGKKFRIALPLKQWPTEQLGEVIDLIKTSRERLDFPQSQPYEEIRDIWNQYLRSGGLNLSPDIADAIRQTKSIEQIALSSRSR